MQKSTNFSVAPVASNHTPVGASASPAGSGADLGDALGPAWATLCDSFERKRQVAAALAEECDALQQRLDRLNERRLSAFARLQDKQVLCDLGHLLLPKIPGAHRVDVRGPFGPLFEYSVRFLGSQSEGDSPIAALTLRTTGLGPMVLSVADWEISSSRGLGAADLAVVGKLVDSPLKALSLTDVLRLAGVIATKEAV